MGTLARLIARQAMRRLAEKSGVSRYLWLLPLVPFLMILGLILSVGLFVAIEAGSMDSGGCGISTPTAPGSNPRTEAQFVHYLESQQISVIAAAGITGNLEQENGFSPATNGGGVGIAQWSASRGAVMAAWDQQHGMDPATTGGQLAYLVYDLRTTYAKLLAELNSATSPGQAAIMFETTYELCSGVLGYMQVALGSLCNDPMRRQYAASAYAAATGGASSAVPVSYNPAGTCTVSGSESARAMLTAAEKAVAAHLSYSTSVNPSGLLVGWRSDCSGFVSWVLNQGGVKTVTAPGETTVTFPSTQGIAPGLGSQVTLWDRPLPGQLGHVIVDILGYWFESGGQLGGGPAPMDASAVQAELGIANPASLATTQVTGNGFSPLHPVGL